MARRKIKAGSTSQTIPIFVQDTTSISGGGLSGLVFNTSGLTAKYRREGDNTWTTISLVTATLGTYTSSGFISDGGGIAGGYEFDPPNAALAAGAKWVDFQLYGAANMLGVQIEVELDGIDYQTDVGTAVMDLANGVETGVTLRQAQRAQLAAAAGKADGAAGTTMHFRDQADTKNRITATVDSSGNRTAVTLDVS